MTTDPQLSITIPVRNAAQTLETCLASIRRAVTIPHEVLVVDGGSSDASVSIAHRWHATVIEGNHGLLEARRIAAQRATGSVVMLLDADQILQGNAIDTAVSRIRNGKADMIAIGETIANRKSLYGYLSDCDKRLLSLNITAHLDPKRGVILPRLFKRDLLVQTFDTIPTYYDDIVLAMDHALIYAHATAISNAIDFIPGGLAHEEPSRLQDVWKKNYRWGKSIGKQLASGVEPGLTTSKLARRGFKTGSLWLKVASTLFLTIKTPPYVTGIINGLLIEVVSDIHTTYHQRRAS